MVGIDWDADEDWTAEQAAAVAALNSHVVIAEELLFEATGQAFPGAYRAVLRPCPTSRCGPGRSLAWGDYGDDNCGRGQGLRLPLPYPLLTHDACGNALTAQLVVPSTTAVSYTDGESAYWTSSEPVEWDSGDSAFGLPLAKVVAVDGTVSLLQPDVDFRVIEPTTIELQHLAGQSSPVWPVQCQSLRSGQPGTWAVEVAYGAYPPAPVAWAAQELAVALLQRTCGSGDCPLPEGVTTVTIHDTVMRLASSMDWAKARSDVNRWLTGISDVDLALWSYSGARAARVIRREGRERFVWERPAAIATWQGLAVTPVEGADVEYTDGSDTFWSDGSDAAWSTA